MINIEQIIYMMRTLIINVNALLTIVGARRWLRSVKVNGGVGYPHGLSFNDFLGYLDSRGNPPSLFQLICHIHHNSKCVYYFGKSW